MRIWNGLWICILLTSCTSSPPDEDVVDVTVYPADVLFIGHSQVNHQMPGYFQWLSDQSGRDLDTQRQVIGGANLEENYVLASQTSDERSSTYDPDGKYLYFSGRISNKGINARASITQGPSHVIITEEHGLVQAQARSSSSFQATHGVSFPSAEFVANDSDNFLASTYQHTYQLGSGLSYYHETISANPSAQVYLYENFFPVVNGSTHCSRFSSQAPTKTLSELNSWRQRVSTYANVWSGLAAEMNNRRGQTVSGFSYGDVQIPDTEIANGASVEVIPGARALSVLVERICAGQVGSLTNPNELWMDHVHASELGNYFLALVMYAAIYGQSPSGVDLSGVGTALDSTPLSAPDSSVAQALQNLAWDIVSGAATANSSDIASCPGITTVPTQTEQICIDDSDTETIPSY